MWQKRRKRECQQAKTRERRSQLSHPDRGTTEERMAAKTKRRTATSRRASSRRRIAIRDGNGTTTSYIRAGHKEWESSSSSREVYGHGNNRLGRCWGSSVPVSLGSCASAYYVADPVDPAAVCCFPSRCSEIYSSVISHDSPVSDHALLESFLP